MNNYIDALNYCKDKIERSIEQSKYKIFICDALRQYSSLHPEASKEVAELLIKVEEFIAPENTFGNYMVERDCPEGTDFVYPSDLEINLERLQFINHLISEYEEK